MGDREEKKSAFSDPEFVATWKALEEKYGSWEKGTKIWDTSRFLVTKRRIDQVVEEIRNGADPDQYNPKELFYAQQAFATKGNRVLYQQIMRVCKDRLAKGEFDARGNWTRPDQQSL